MIQTKEVQLKDRDGNPVSVHITTFPGSVGLEIFSKSFLLVIPVILPALDSGPSSEKTKSLENLDIDFSKISQAIVSSMTDKKIVSIVHDVVSMTEVVIGGVKSNLSVISEFDMVFAGNYALLMKVVKSIMEVNYSDFFGENGIGDLIAMIPGVSKILP